MKSNPTISTQVISENVNVLFKKFPQLSLAQVKEHANMLAGYCEVTTITLPVIEKAFDIRDLYQFQWYDSTILSSAILSNCAIIYTEDLANNQLIDGSLRIINPFLPKE